MDISLLPNEILDMIQDYVSSQTRARLRRTCRRMNDVIRKAKVAKKRVYLIGLYNFKPITYQNNLIDKGKWYSPVIFKEKCDNRLIHPTEFPRIDFNSLKLEENPKRIVQQLVEKYPNFDEMHLEWAIIDDTFFEQIVAAGAELSEIRLIHFDKCVFANPLMEYHKWFCQIRLICFQWCATEIEIEPHHDETKFCRLLYYGQDIADSSKLPYDSMKWKEETNIMQQLLSPYHALDFIKALLKKEGAVTATYTFPRIIVHAPNPTRISPNRIVEYLEVIKAFQNLENTENCSVSMSKSSLVPILKHFMGEHANIIVTKHKPDGDMVFNFLICYYSELNFDELFHRVRL